MEALKEEKGMEIDLGSEVAYSFDTVCTLVLAFEYGNFLAGNSDINTISDKDYFSTEGLI